ncbi:hypothetical protein M8C21_024913 [Ambrosia artemisiifolia]|uniref:Purple acid phosphatase n=1 Tax=Ambrosia artemisiifolia TaxID=4212 RepID=A0AAD5GQF8_AMBAR|nr:hypothetical protein M8C21_024913 [Ambrosia artemisiifolia]
MQQLFHETISVKMLFNIVMFSLTFYGILASAHLIKDDYPITEQPLSKIAIHRSVLALHDEAFIKAYPTVLGLKGQDVEWVTVELTHPIPSNDDWVGVFSPAKFNASTCYYESEDSMQLVPYICSAPIKYTFANYSNPGYAKTGKSRLRFQIINQRADFSFALFSGGLSNPKLVAYSNFITFANPKAPLYPRLALGKSWNEMTVTWTSGYNINEATPVVSWGVNGQRAMLSPATTLTFHQNSMCASPASTVGWRDPGFIHTSFLRDLWPNTKYSYKIGHKLVNGTYIWSKKKFSFTSPPSPGQESLQRVVIFGDLGKAERDGSNEYNNYQPGSLNTTDQLIKDINNIDIVFHIGDIVYSNGYISQWDQFTSQVEPIASVVPYMIASGNHERDVPGSGSFYDGNDSGGECGVPAETTFYVPAENRAKFWYSADYGMFRFCIADTEHDWREGSEQYKFIEKCLATADRKNQPWLIFAAHRVLGYSSDFYYALAGSFAEPEGRESLQKLWQKYKVDIALFGHVHNYERTCPVYEEQCMNSEKSHYSGTVNGTIHIVVGGAGAHLSKFSDVNTTWSLKKDLDFGFVKMTAYNKSSLLFEYKKSRDGKVYDSFTMSRDYKDVLACVHDGCEPTNL